MKPILENKLTIMDWLTEFLNSEKALYLSVGIIGVISVLVGFFFLIVSQQKSFAIAMILFGVIEMAVMFPKYLNYQHKIDDKVFNYKSNGDGLLAAVILHLAFAIIIDNFGEKHTNKYLINISKTDIN